MGPEDFQALGISPRKAISPRTAIADVCVFDGARLTDPITVVIQDGRIVDLDGDDGGTALVVDGAGGTLLPGLIDAHVHLHGEANLHQARTFGVTTMLDMASIPALADSLRGRPGLPDIRSAGIPASAPGGVQTTRMGFPPESTLRTPGEAENFVATRVAEGSDYLKVIVENPAQLGPAALNQPTLNALTAAARRRGLRTVAHASSPVAVQMALAAGVDAVTHAPLNAELDPDSVATMVTDRRVSIPTLTMMETVASMLSTTNAGQHLAYENARATVAALHRAGVPILAGTDANAAPGSPAHVPHGDALHHELELLVAAGLSTVDALRGATVLPAQFFGLTDRGSIEVGQRADLVLMAGDPIRDIRATRTVRAVWVAGNGGLL